MKIYDEYSGCREVGYGSTAVSDGYGPLKLDGGIVMSRGKLEERFTHPDLDPEAVCPIHSARRFRGECSPRRKDSEDEQSCGCNYGKLGQDGCYTPLITDMMTDSLRKLLPAQ